MPPTPGVEGSTARLQGRVPFPGRRCCGPRMPHEGGGCPCASLGHSQTVNATRSILLHQSWPGCPEQRRHGDVPASKEETLGARKSPGAWPAAVAGGPAPWRERVWQVLPGAYRPTLSRLPQGDGPVVLISASSIKHKRRFSALRNHLSPHSLTFSSAAGLKISDNQARHDRARAACRRQRVYLAAAVG